MRKTISYLGLIAIFPMLFSCSDKRQMLIGTWHATSLQNPDMDSFFKNSQAYIDTIGKNHDSATNMALYGVANMDSMRKVLQVQFDSTRTMQLAAVTNTIFKFRKDSVVELSFNGAADSSKWYLSGKNKLTLTDLNSQNSSEKAEMEILELTNDVLKLKFIENKSTSLVTFKREK